MMPLRAEEKETHLRPIGIPISALRYLWEYEQAVR